MEEEHVLFCTKATCSIWIISQQYRCEISHANRGKWIKSGGILTYGWGVLQRGRHMMVLFKFGVLCHSIVTKVVALAIMVLRMVFILWCMTHCHHNVRVYNSYLLDECDHFYYYLNLLFLIGGVTNSKRSLFVLVRSLFRPSWLRDSLQLVSLIDWCVVEIFTQSRDCILKHNLMF